MYHFSKTSLPLCLLALFALISCDEAEPFTPNHGPIIQTVTIVDGGVMVGDSATLICHATDEDNDSLSYFWTAPAGSLAGSGEQVNWTPPDYAALYPFTVRVEDGNGGVAERDFEVQVHGLGHQTWNIFNTDNSDNDNNWTLSIAISRSDIVWLGGESANITRLENNTWATWYRNPGEIISLATDSHDHLWFGSDHEPLTMFDGNVFSEYPAGGMARPVAVDINDDIWIGNMTGLSNFDRSTWTHYTPANSELPYPEILTIACDSSGTVWAIANDSSIPASVLVKVDGSEIHSFPLERPWSLPGGLAVDMTDNIWIGTYAGLVKFDGSEFSTYPLPIAGDPSCGALAVDHNNRVWCGLQDGLAGWDGSNWTIYTSQNSDIPPGWVSSIAIDSKNNKWLSLWMDNGIAVFNEQGIH